MMKERIAWKEWMVLEGESAPGECMRLFPSQSIRRAKKKYE